MWHWLIAWVEEHGSARTLRDHIALLREQNAVLERRISQLEAENAILTQKLAVAEGEKRELQLQCEQQKVEIETLLVWGDRCVTAASTASSHTLIKRLAAPDPFHFPLGGRGMSTTISVPAPRTDLILKLPPT